MEYYRDDRRRWGKQTQIIHNLFAPFFFPTVTTRQAKLILISVVIILVIIHYSLATFNNAEKKIKNINWLELGDDVLTALCIDFP